MANPNTSIFPTAIATDSDLPPTTNTFSTTLNSNHNSTDVTLVVLTTTNLNVPCIVRIGNENILATGKTPITLTGCIRGFDNSTAAAHSIGDVVSAYIFDWHFNQMAAEIKALEILFGINGTNFLLSGQTVGGDLTGNLPNPSLKTISGVAGTYSGFTIDSNGRVSVVKMVNTVSYSATPSFDLFQGRVQTITLTGNVTSSTVSNLTPGSFVQFVIIQDSTGGRSFVWPTNVKGAIDISLATANKHCIQEFVSPDGVNLYSCGVGTII